MHDFLHYTMLFIAVGSLVMAYTVIKGSRLYKKLLDKKSQRYWKIALFLELFFVLAYWALFILIHEENNYFLLAATIAAICFFGSFFVFYVTSITTSMTERLLELNLAQQELIALKSKKLAIVQEELSDKDIHLQQIFNSAPDGMAVISPDFELLAANPRFLEMFGIDRDVLVKDQYCRDILKSEHCGGERCLLERIRKGEEKVIVEMEKERMDGSGSKFSCLVTAVPLTNSKGEIWGMVEHIMDVSVLKEKERREQEMQRQIFHSSKLASVGELAAGIGHEINNPLTIIKGNVKLLQREMQKQGVGEGPYLGILDVMTRTITRIELIVRGLNAYANISNRKVQNISINEIIINSQSLIDYQFKMASVQLELKLDNNLPMIEGNPSYVQQLLMNLLSNAKDACSGKGKFNGLVVVSSKYLAAEKMLSISITDNGVGIPADKLDRIFDMFYSSKSTGTGVGMGLAMAHKFVKELNGKISVASKEGTGTTFTVSFPIF